MLLKPIAGSFREEAENGLSISNLWITVVELDVTIIGQQGTRAHKNVGYGKLAVEARWSTRKPSILRVRLVTIKRVVLSTNGMKRNSQNTRRLSRNTATNAWETTRRRNLPSSSVLDLRMRKNNPTMMWPEVTCGWGKAIGDGNRTQTVVFKNSRNTMVD